jgi:serine/threonine protein kinase
MDAGLVGSVVDSKYHVLGLLGHGGMGAVFRAVHLGTDRTVALKVIVPDHAERSDFGARFEREARACGRLRHPNIVDVTDFGYADRDGRRLAYLVMEYLDGCSLADVLRDGKGLPVAFVVDVLDQVGSALEEAHRAGILHRDLKPDNIWLKPNRRGGYTVKVLDFGLAKLGGIEAAGAALDAPAERASSPEPPPDEKTASDLEEEATLARPPSPSPTSPPAIPDDDAGATAVGSVIGTPAYMSPEQCQGRPLTPRSDVYSLGVVAYRLLAGALPFAGPPQAQLAAHVKEAPPHLRTHRRDLPRPAAELVMRALSKTPEDRPASAGAFTEMFAARAQSTGAFVQEAVLMYLEHARAFLSVSILALSPVLLLGLLAAINAIAFIQGREIVPRTAGIGFVVACILITVGPGMMLVQGAVVPAVMQAVVAPLQPIDVGTLQRRFRPRLRAYFRGVAPMLWVFAMTALWQGPARSLILALRPLVDDERVATAVLAALATALLPNLPIVIILGLFFLKSGSLRGLPFLGAVAVLEDLPPRAALLRANLLARSATGARAMRAATIGLAFSLSLVASIAFTWLAHRIAPPVALGSLALLFAVAFVLIGPFIAVVGALTYLRARRALGEPLDRALADFERSVLPESHWQMPERERVATLIASRW